MMYGYVRASKGLQPAAEQRKALQEAECSEIVEEQEDAKDRPVLNHIIEALRPGQGVTVTSLDRLATSVHQLLSVLGRIMAKGAYFRSLHEGIDSRKLGGLAENVLQLLQAVLAAERGFLVERVQAGRTNAMRNGIKLGRRNKLTHDQVQHAKRLLELGEGGRAVARTFGVSEATMYRNIRKLKGQG